MKNLKLLFSVIVMFLSFMTSCVDDNSGDYQVIDIDCSINGMSENQMENDIAKGVGMIMHIEKIGEKYKLTADNDPDAILFSENQENEYKAHGGSMILTFTSPGAILSAKNNGNSVTWTLKKVK